MKKVYLKICLNKNLGDDIFLDMFLNRYPNVSIYATSNYKYNINNYSNIHIYSGFKYKLINKIGKIFKEYNLVERILKINKDYMVYIGGSIFMENHNMDYWQKNVKQYKSPYIPYYILGCNIGPYTDKEYIPLLIDEVFKNAQVVSFRDKASYDLCNFLNNVRYTTDIVFAMELNNEKKSKKRVIFSIIDWYKKANEKDAKIYEEKIIELTREFYNKGYEIMYMSFCKAEGDEQAIERIESKMNDIKVQNYYYNGNIKEALEELQQSEIIVGTRFHANILGILMNKKIIPIAYNNKTVNILKDLNFKGKLYTKENLKNMNIDEIILDNQIVEADLQEEKHKANKHFEELDKILK